jgi:hypothetical protein
MNTCKHRSTTILSVALVFAASLILRCSGTAQLRPLLYSEPCMTRMVR